MKLRAHGSGVQRFSTLAQMNPARFVRANKNARASNEARASY